MKASRTRRSCWRLLNVRQKTSAKQSENVGGALANAAPPCSFARRGHRRSLFPFPRRRMERREAPGVCEAPHGAGHFLHNTDAPCQNGFCESPFGRVCEARPEAACGGDLKVCEALPPSRCASRRSTPQASSRCLRKDHGPRCRRPALCPAIRRVMTCGGTGMREDDPRIGVRGCQEQNGNIHLRRCLSVLFLRLAFFASNTRKGIENTCREFPAR